VAIIEAVGGQLDPDLVGVGPVRTHTVAIAHDYLTQRGGAERVVLTLANAFPGSPVLTSLYDAAGTYPEFADLPICSTGIDRYEPFRRNHRMALPLLARTFSSLVAPADVVVCSSSGWAHGIRAEGRKVVYCHNPARWLYQTDGYEPGRGGMARAAMGVLERRLVTWDRLAALSADRYLANSTVVRDRIRTAYGIDAEVLHPPPGLDPAGPQVPVAGLDAGFLLCVSRLISYKNVDAVVEAMRTLGDQSLVVVGTGPDAARLQADAPSNVFFAGSVSDAELRWLYANAAAHVLASYEDFGLSPLEAASFGKPSALLRYGGFLDTLDEGTTGVFFDEPEPDAIAGAVRELLDTSWREDDIVDHADRFSERRFVERMHEIVAEEAGAGGPAGSAPVPAPMIVAASRHAQVAAPAVQAWRGAATKAAVAAVDVLAVTAAIVLAFVCWRAWRAPGGGGFDSTHLWLGALSVPLWIGSFARAELYRARVIASQLEELRRIIRGVGVGVFATAAVGGLARLPGARLWYVLAALFGVVLTTAGRVVLRRVFDRRRRAGRMLRSVVLAGTNAEARELAAMFERDPSLGYQVVGAVSDGVPAEGIEHLGTLQQARSAVRRTGATGVVIATTAVDHDTSNRLVRELGDIGVHVELSSSLRDVAHRRLTMRPVSRVPLLHVQPRQHAGWRASAKRAFDVTVALAALVLAAPVLAVAALAVKLDSAGPVLFRQRRVGRNGRSFHVLKLRTMVVGAEDLVDELRDQNEVDGPLFKLRHDPRVTRVGRVLRRLSIDELPQFWNVVRGEMSIVGPRPALPEEARQWNDDLHARLRVRPGITGMWQVNGRSSSTFAEYERLDLYYVDNWSLATDLAIVARTVPAVIRTRGAF
jgi:exopolysaccharide biosynthesis polyprenyl glycosylphosphotransferase